MNGINKKKEERCQQQHTNKQTNNITWHKQKTQHSIVKDLLWSILVTAPEFHFEMSELKAEALKNTAQYKQRYKHQTVEVDGRVGAMNGINKKKEECCQQQHTNNKQKTQHSIVKDLLDSIVVTAPVFHFEMSELKAELDKNTAQ